MYIVFMKAEEAKVMNKLMQTKTFKQPISLDSTKTSLLFSVLCLCVSSVSGDSLHTQWTGVQ